MPVCAERSCLVLFTYCEQGTNAYWGEGFSDIIGLTVCAHASRADDLLLTCWVADNQTRFAVCVTVFLARFYLIYQHQIRYESWDVYGIFLGTGRCESLQNV